MICEVRSDCQFCDLWLARFWYGGWVLGDVSWVADGCGHGSQVRLEWVTEGSQWLRFCGFFLPPLVVAGSG